MKGFFEFAIDTTVFVIAKLDEGESLAMGKVKGHAVAVQGGDGFKKGDLFYIVSLRDVNDTVPAVIAADKTFSSWDAANRAWSAQRPAFEPDIHNPQHHYN